MSDHLKPKDARDTPLSRDELLRYSRHLLLPEVGVAGQEKLKRSSVLLVGAGGLGSPAALYLAAAGVGRLGLVDFDVVDASNLQRQILHGTADVGRSKLQSARASIEALNPDVRIDTHETRLTSANAMNLLAPYDVVLDGTDNFATRYLVNDACVLLGKPNVYGSVFRFEGQASVFWAGHGPCYRCLYPEPPPPGLVPNCAEGGVLGVLPGLIGMIQATETLKVLLGAGETLVGRLLLYNALTMNFREMKLGRDPACPICGEARRIHHLIDYDEFCGAGGHPPAAPENDMDVEPRQLKAELDQRRPLLLLDVREPYEHELTHLPGTTLIPLGELPRRWPELDARADVVCYCRSGARSARAAGFLRSQGFTRVRNLTGGILRWADDVDPSVPKY
jgi:molybdopterin/thiamine biosynthesis adenylyltransferase/rhodanese-related sulfurtransferase